ncbi:hypothetical protein EBR21_09005 [bacterium]|nr:hypothetical protein [bacterium]
MQTSDRRLGAVDLRECDALSNGPHAAASVNCDNLMRKQAKNISGFEGILVQEFAFRDYSGAPWQVDCHPTLIRLQIKESEIAADSSRALFIYLQRVGVNNCNEARCMIAPYRPIPATEIAAKANRKGDFLEVGLLLLGKCAANSVEFKPFISDGFTHRWEAFDGNHLVK